MFQKLHVPVSEFQFKLLQLQRDCATGWVKFWQKVEDWKWEAIFCGHDRTIFNHCDVIGQQSYRFLWKNGK